MDNGIVDNIPAKVGFRRWLAAMYCHTGCHIVAAPMAHYLALHGSRFRYSHESGYLPIYGIENFMLGNKTIMQYKSIGIKKVPVHRCMNYLYRPSALDGLCIYEFFAKIYETTRKPSTGKRKRNEQAQMEYKTDHPGHTHFVPVFYKEPIIPYFPWNFLPSTSQFTTSLISPVNTTDADYSKKEDYCRRFILLFVPFRKKDDLMIDGSYTRCMQHAIKTKTIGKEMIEVAENIQTIHNSLNSPMVENILTSTTELEEPECFEEEQQDCNNVDINDLLTQIGTGLASTTNETLNEEAMEMKLHNKNVLSPRECDKVGTLEENAFEFDEDANISIAEEKEVNEIRQIWFKAQTSVLNTLVLETCLTKKQMETNRTDPHGQSQDTQPSMKATWNVDATGTWESIVGWANVNGLDPEQQTAFEIMVSTFVLSFHKDKENNEEESETTKTQFEALCKLARKKSDDPNPLRLFVTGPAGAGKCKFDLKSFLSGWWKQTPTE